MPAKARTKTAAETPQYTDPIDWARHFWHEQDFGDGEDAFLAMSSVLRFHRLVTDAVESALKEHELNLTDYMLLMTLQLSPTGTRLISGLARSLMIHATTATLATDRLEARGLLARSPHPTDRRATEVTLSAAGRKLVRAATATLRGTDFGFPGSTKKDRKDLISLLARLRGLAGDTETR